MKFNGYREDHRGNWFGGGTAMLYILKKGVGKFYIINEQEKHVIRVRDEKQIELLSNCFYGPQVEDEEIEWLIDKAGGRFKYYDSVEEYIAIREEEFKNL